MKTVDLENNYILEINYGSILLFQLAVGKLKLAPIA